MESAITITSSFTSLRLSPIPSSQRPPFVLRVSASSSASKNSKASQNPITHNLKLTARAVVFTITTASIFHRFQRYPSLAETPQTLPEVIIDKIQEENPSFQSNPESIDPFLTQSKEILEFKEQTIESKADSADPLEVKEEIFEANPESVEALEVEEEILEAKPESFEALKAIEEISEANPQTIEALQVQLDEKQEAGEDELSLRILRSLILAQPEQPTWKFQIAKLLNKMGNVEEAGSVYEEILAKDPLSIDALAEIVLLLKEKGEIETMRTRLDGLLKIAEDENKGFETREMKLIIAQLEFLLDNFEEALRRYEELVREDPKDYRPYFSSGVIYGALNKGNEAREQFTKYRELSGRKFDVEGFLKAMKKLRLLTKKLSRNGRSKNDSFVQEEAVRS